MRLSSNLWLEKEFYIDVDHMGQIRVVGPGDHLYFGMINGESRDYEITKVYYRNNELFIKGYFYDSKVQFFYPVMGDIRTLRTYVYKKDEKAKTFFEIREAFPDVLIPNKFHESVIDGTKRLNFERHFGKEFYGSELRLSATVKVERKDNYFILSSSEPVIPFEIKVYDSRFFKQEFFADPFLRKQIFFEKFGIEGDIARTILHRAEAEVDHLLKYKKTSGYDYGTVFPRDWTEAAFLGLNDFSKEALFYIAKQSLKYVSVEGEGWHERCVGEFAYKCNLSHVPNIDRDMVDIEPRYMLLFGQNPDIFLNNETLFKKIKRVASFIITQARENYLIQFEENPHFRNFKAGNWRDSSAAYLGVSSHIIPYDTNAVFYPAALRIIEQFADNLHIKDKDLKKIVSDWQNKKELFKFKNKDGKPAYALAIYDFKNKNNYKKLEINHTDEAYDLIFNNSNEEDIKSLAERILSNDYFYTKIGPLIVGKNEGYNHNQYHGEVIWLKQMGLCSMGFKNQYRKEGFSEETNELIKKTIKYLFDSLVYSFGYLNLFPELFVDYKESPVLYSERRFVVEGHMNKIQLWSAEAARRIVFDYYDVFFKS
ncbi:hypothetical protein COX95_03545 [bacterium CG_4_10_14_0_2_um_filter_33_32]|nr:MAG: hypothetical protein AUJ93_04750 [bacterium CG2_30_33_46]PIR67514.1 MAG: hypothetical protein COU50_02685 [bacterium CG10_big_fil_rev_8_21_14_0_10_33_18]PIU76268.1 MAG: hypothetical protein COS74_04935 [bacterium CG06_land_8_20_14_3_00_33_50]PIW81540.1 MAG: hypothetical protein COZ97_01240 [bacterium CG_4_8_14_3_um_filter_33_28]PIY85779.1 MAG: hypothetical protein COY76_00425 [bacterium CG_4_10_14_0_8_um_filter_33_57]PIZ85637.1 MAG: hypothetical protein COX95_03545 [bacterium CG_4_10_1